MNTAKSLSIVSIVLLLTATLCADALPQEKIKRKRKQGTGTIQRKGTTQRQGARGTSPLSTFKGIEQAWAREDAVALSRFTGDGKAFVSVTGIGRRGGYFTRPQVRYLFQRLFKSYKQTKFDFVKYHNLDKPQRKVHGIAQRRYRNKRNGKFYNDKVYVTLRKEGETWVVAEIKTTR
jgi:hypothetical protein